MKLRASRPRRMLMAVTATTLAVGLGAWAPVASAPPGGDCPVAFPEPQLTDGQPVSGLTVSKGTTPEGFTGEVLGVLYDGIAPDLDMVMVRLTSPEIDRVGGIWAGMSGSPVYAEDGRLIGAVSYGLAFGPSPVAGVTPYAEMDNYLAAAPAPRVKVGKATARKIAASSDVTAAEAEQGFAQLRMPLGVTGVGPWRLAGTTGRSWIPKQTYATGRATADSGADVDSIVAGGNLAAAASFGDITIGGVGTATATCGDQVVGFGHPFFFQGPSTAYLMPADAIYIQEDPTFYPFKVANLAAPVGRITDDHLAGITGVKGALPASMEVGSDVSFAGRSRSGSTDVAIPDFGPTVGLFQVLANQDRVIDGIIGGSALQSWTITGHTPAGLAFTLPFTNRFQSRYDISFATVFEMPDALWALGNIDGVTIDSARAQAKVVADKTTYAVSSVQQYRKGAWVTVNKDNPVTGVAGRDLVLRVVLSTVGGTRSLHWRVPVPATASGARGQVRFTGGNDLFGKGESMPNSVRGILRKYASMVRNDQVQAQLSIGIEKQSFDAQAVLGPLSKVISGSRAVPV